MENAAVVAMNSLQITLGVVLVEGLLLLWVLGKCAKKTVKRRPEKPTNSMVCTAPPEPPKEDKPPTPMQKSMTGGTPSTNAPATSPAVPSANAPSTTATPSVGAPSANQGNVSQAGNADKDKEKAAPGQDDNGYEKCDNIDADKLAEIANQVK